MVYNEIFLLFLEQGDSRKVSRPFARIQTHGGQHGASTKFGYNQMQGWKVMNRYRVLQVNLLI